MLLLIYSMFPPLHLYHFPPSQSKPACSQLTVEADPEVLGFVSGSVRFVHRTVLLSVALYSFLNAVVDKIIGLLGVQAKKRMCLFRLGLHHQLL